MSQEAGGYEFRGTVLAATSILVSLTGYGYANGKLATVGYMDPAEGHTFYEEIIAGTGTTPGAKITVIGGRYDKGSGGRDDSGALFGADGKTLLWNALDWLSPQPSEVWVDDDFTDATPGWGTTHFATIQDGVTAVAAGGTVNVAAGTYNESVTIDKQITLLGAQAGVDARNRSGAESIIDATGYGVGIYIGGEGDHTVIDGFEVKNSEYVDERGAGVGLEDGADYVTIRNTCVHNNTNQGIQSLLRDSGHPINNYILIEHCRLEANGDAGVKVYGSSHVTVQYNLFRDNGAYGVLVWNYRTLTGYVLDDVQILRNQFFNNNDNIKLDGDTKGITNAVVAFNEVSSGNRGIYVRKNVTSPQIYNNIVALNDIGIYIRTESYPIGDLVINKNNIYSNTEYGLKNDVTATVDATYNWWGDASGPDDDAEVINGTGDKISINVDATPWLDDEVGDYEKVATQTQTNIGPSGGQVQVTITSIPTASNYLDVYQVGSLSGDPVTSGETFPGGFDKRSNIVWGIVETGTVTSTLVFDYSNQPGVSDASTIEILKRDNAQDNIWDEVTETSRDDVAKTITLTGVTSFSEYALGAGGDNTLPVVLSLFTAQLIDNTPILNWITQTETNNSGWNVYRGESENAISNEEAFQMNSDLGLIPGAGTTTEPTEYSFEDFFNVYAGNTYYYWLESVDYSGETDIYGPISLTIPENEWQNPNSPEIPKPYGLHQNYPNPFNPNTEISFMMKENCIAELTVYNIKGEKVSNLFQNKSVSKDELIISNWEGKDESGKEVSSGIYFYKLRTTKGNHIRKMVLMK